MTNLEKRAMLAERFDGYVRQNLSWPCGKKRELDRDYWQQSTGRRLLLQVYGLPDYENDLNQIARIEARIAEMGSEARAKYRNALWDQMQFSRSAEYSMDWQLICATSFARFYAAVAVIEDLVPPAGLEPAPHGL